ncbi:MAG TPA: cytochrome c-type biogenesis CcmF C-terminal domain-containing protein, partial [Pseudomonadales bacterium]|nr:cytochrome c-type biogenesis CcmF C-terminal domain-containing protein [Pseudomonadales bacterium]
GKLVAKMFPEKRHSLAGGSVMTEAAMDPGVTRDLYLALGDPIDRKAKAWAVRIHYKPFVRWIWAGGMLVALGGFVTVLDRRYRAARRKVPVETTLVAGAAS